MSAPRIAPDVVEARRASLPYPCTYCGVEAGRVCVGADGQPLRRFAAHQPRLKAAGATLNPVDETERRDPWHRPTLTAREHPADRDALLNRRRELLCDRAAGDDWSQVKAAELLRIEEQLNPDRPHIDPDQDYRFGRGGPR